MKKFYKGLLALTGSSLAIYLAYQSYYNKKFKLISQPSSEKPLEPMSSDESYQISWIDERAYYYIMEEVIRPTLNIMKQEGYIQRQGYPLAYHYYPSSNPKATLVILHGFLEYKEQYSEVIYYLIQAGIEVFIYDQKDHGFSRKDDSIDKVDIDSFDVYIDDLQAMMKEVIIPNKRTANVFLYGHSMGGAVAMGSMQSKIKKWVKGIILSAPMLSINSGPIPPALANLIASAGHYIGAGDEAIPLTDTKSFKWLAESDRDFHIARSSGRYKYYNDLDKRLHKQSLLTGSINWVYYSFKTLQTMVYPKYLSKVTIPVLMFRAEKDTVVKQNGIFTAQAYLPNVTSVLVKNGQHELIFEPDHNLHAYVVQIIQFINSNLKDPNEG